MACPFRLCDIDDLALVTRPQSIGGQLEAEGIVEVVSSLERDGRPVFRDLRWGVYVVLKAPNASAAACFRQYGLPTDPAGLYAGTYKPFHLIGLEKRSAETAARAQLGGERTALLVKALAALPCLARMGGRDANLEPTDIRQYGCPA